MKVLIIGPKFRNYINIISNEFKNRGFFVSFLYQEFPFFGKVAKFSIRLSLLLNSIYLRKKSKKYFGFDLVIIVNGNHLVDSFLKTLKCKNPSSRFVLYLWDDVNRIYNFSSLRKYYDDIFSFSLNDAINNNIKFLPLFYSNYNSKPGNRTPLILYSAMGNHSDRIKVINSFMRRYYDLVEPSKIFITIGFVKFLLLRTKNLLNNKRKNYVSFRFHEIDYGLNDFYVSNCSVVLDIQFAGQNGLTIRTIEAIGKKKKIITTNENVVKYDFYNENNILVIDRNNPTINIDLKTWISNPPDYDEKVISKYSISSFVDVILNISNHHYLK